jgi:short-subunit dehydrogenase
MAEVGRETVGKRATHCATPDCEAVAGPVDVGSRDDVEHLVQVALLHFGRIDTWINDAGVAIYGRLDAVSEADSRRLFDTNFWGVANGSPAALPEQRKSGGALISVGSEVSDAVLPLQGMYSASKRAVKGFTDALRIEVEELDQSAVTITLIQPTALNTPYPQHARNYMDREPKLPSPQIDPEDVAEAILEAAVHGGRDITAGTVAKLDTLASKVMPSVADKMAAMQANRQQADEPPRDPEGALYRPSGGGTVHGQGGALRH